MLLTDNDILQWVKIKLRIPFQKLEVTDEELLYVIKNEVLPEYSNFEPLCKEWYLDVNKKENIVDGHDNLFRIPMDDEPIRSVVELIFQNNSILYGHPVVGVFTYDQLPSWFLKSYNARTTAIWGFESKTFQFIHPNLLRIYGDRNNCIVRYTCDHTRFETVYTKRVSVISDLALASAMMYIGSIRKRFSTIESPFGTIQLDGDSLISEGKELWNEAMEKLKLIPPPYLFTDNENQ